MRKKYRVYGTVEILIETIVEREEGTWTTKDSDDAENALFESALLWAREELEQANRDNPLWADVRTRVDSVVTADGERVVTWPEVQV